MEACGPRSQLLAVWNVVRLFLLVAVVYESVMFVGFSNYCPLNLLSMVISALYSVDIPLQFFIIPVKDGKVDRKHYLKTWFMVDIVSVIPSLLVLIIESDYCELERGSEDISRKIYPSHGSIVPLIHLRMLRLLRASQYVANLRSYLSLRSGKDDSADPEQGGEPEPK
jgi:hypothetical protein